MNQENQTGGLRCHDPAECVMGQLPCPTPKACNCAPPAAQPSRECLQQSAEVDFSLESMPPVDGLDLIGAEYAKTFGRTPAAAMAATVSKVKDMLLMWWASHREAIAAALQAAPPAPAAVAAPAKATIEQEPLHITHGPLMRHAAALLRSRKPALPEHESVAAELESAADGQATPSGEPSPEWLEVARAALAAAPAQAAYSREEWIAQATQVYVDDGDDLKAAQELARWHWNQQDWASGEIDDPREVAREDLAGRDKPAAAQAARIALAAEFLLAVHDERGMPPEQQTYVPEAWDRAVSELRAIVASMPTITPAQEHATQLAGQGQEVLQEVFKRADQLIDVMDDHDQNAPEHRSYVSGAYSDSLNDLRRAVTAARAAPIQAQEDARVLMGYMHPGAFHPYQYKRWQDGNTVAVRLNGWKDEHLQVPVYAKQSAIDAAREAQGGAA